MCEEAELDIPDSVIDWALHTGNEYMDKSKNPKCKKIIVFYHLPILNFFYRAIRKFKKGVKVKLDLTKKHHSLHLEANKYVDGGNLVKFCYTDTNCRFKVKWRDNCEKNMFFSSMEELLQMT